MAQRVGIWETIVKESGLFQGAAVVGGAGLPPLMELYQKQVLSDRGKLLVTVCPPQLEFCLDQQESHKQVLTLFNINNFHLRFQLQSNAPRRYAVLEPEGVIRPHCFIDVVVRHREVCEANVGRRDQLRIVVREEGGALKGYRDIPVTLRATRGTSPTAAAPVTDEEEEAPAPQDAERRWGSAASSGYHVALVVAMACLLALVLPLEGTSSDQPTFLQLSHQQKLIAAYVLGLVTMLLFRP